MPRHILKQVPNALSVNNKIVFTSPEAMVINSLVSGVFSGNIKPQPSSKTFFSVETHFGTYVHLYSFERSMERPFREFFPLR